MHTILVHILDWSTRTETFWIRNFYDSRRAMLCYTCTVHTTLCHTMPMPLLLQPPGPDSSHP